MKKVLIIDDDEIILESIKKYLIEIGYHVSVAKDGKDGINLFRNTCDFDVVITDIEMPIIDGNAVAYFIRASEKPETPILAITGDFDSILQKKMFNVVLSKPFDLKRLASIIASILR